MFITNGSSDWWNAVEKGMNDGAKEFGAQVEMRRPEGEPAQQIQRIEDVLSLPDVQGVAISVLEAESPGIADKMRDLQKAGKIVIAIDSDGQKDARRAYIGTINRKAGEVAGKVAKTLRPQGGKTVAFVGTAAAANASERREGFFAGAGSLRFASRMLEVFEDGADKAQGPDQRPDRDQQVSRRRASSWASGPTTPTSSPKRSPSSPTCARKSTIVTFDLDELGRRRPRQGRDRRDRLPEPLPDGLPRRALLKAFIDEGPEDHRRDAPRRYRHDRHRRARDRPHQGLARQGDNVIDIDEMKKWLASKGLKSS